MLFKHKSLGGLGGLARGGFSHAAAYAKATAGQEGAKDAKKNPYCVKMKILAGLAAWREDGFLTPPPTLRLRRARKAPSEMRKRFHGASKERKERYLVFEQKNLRVLGGFARDQKGSCSGFGDFTDFSPPEAGKPWAIFGKLAKQLTAKTKDGMISLRGCKYRLCTMIPKKGLMK